MKTLAILMLVALPFVSVGCKSISIDPQVAEEAILQISSNTMNVGLMLLSKDQASWEKTKQASNIARARCKRFLIASRVTSSRPAIRSAVRPSR